MRYLKKELWLKTNSQDETVRMQAEKDWEANAISYQHYFEKIKKHLPCNFLKSYLSRNGFHDYIVLGIAMIKKSKKYSCELQLTNGLETVFVVMYGVQKCKIDINSFQDCIQGKLKWGYCEFEIISKNSIQLTMLCDIQNEMTFQFKSIKLKNSTVLKK